MTAPSTLLVAIVVAAGGLGEGPYEEVPIGSAKAQAFRGGIRILAGHSEWTVPVSALPLAAKDTQAYTGERVPGIAGVDVHCGLVFVSLNLDVGTNVPLAIYELRLAPRQVRRLGTVYGSGVTGCVLAKGARSVACRVGSHVSASVGHQNKMSLERGTAWCKAFEPQ